MSSCECDVKNDQVINWEVFNELILNKSDYVVGPSSSQTTGFCYSSVV